MGVSSLFRKNPENGMHVTPLFIGLFRMIFDLTPLLSYKVLKTHKNAVLLPLDGLAFRFLSTQTTCGGADARVKLAREFLLIFIVRFRTVIIGKLLGKNLQGHRNRAAKLEVE
jgi:hypothetical protein